MAQVQQLVDMGFAEADARRALQQVGNHLEQAIERLLAGAIGGEPEPQPIRLGDRSNLGAGGREDRDMQAPAPLLPAVALRNNHEAPGELGIGASHLASVPPPPALKDAEDLDLSTALEMSMREQQEGLAPAPEGARRHGLPCGLLNIGNTCYVNSLLQTLLHIDEFRERMLRYRTPTELAEARAAAGAAAQAAGAQEPEAEAGTKPEEGGRHEADQEGRRAHGIRLASELRHLFAYSLFTARSCIDPSRLLRELVDQRGQKLPIGSQEDVGEFMLKFIEQLDEGLRSGDFIEGAQLEQASGTAGDAAGVEGRSASADGGAASGGGEAPAEAGQAEPPGTGDACAESVGHSGVGREGDAVAGGPEASGEARRAPEATHAAEVVGEPPSSGAAVVDQAPAAEEGSAPGSGASAPAGGLDGVGPELASDACGAPATDKVAEAPVGSTEASSGLAEAEKLSPVCTPEASSDADQVGADSSQSSTPAAPSGDLDGKKDAELSLLQSLFVGEQVQVFSYRDSGPEAEPADVLRFEDTPSGTTQSEETPTKPDSAADAAKSGGSESADHGPDEARASELPGLVVSEEKSDFLHIFLDVKYKNMYSAWEAASCTEVDYTTPRGFSTTACTSTWIKRLPKFLFFQLQRVAFDQERKAQVKLDDAFDFDSTIHVDRFLQSNRTEATSVASRVRELQRRREQVAAALRGFEDYRGRPGLGIDEVLDWAAECLEENAEGLSQRRVRAGEGGSPAAPELPSPHCVVTAQPPEDAACAHLSEQLRRTAPEAVELLMGVRKACVARASRLRDDLNGLDAEINSAYSGLRERAFELYAIWVHSGIAGSGHYLAYLRDWQHDRWYRLDDALASVVSWEDVRRAAVGQEGSNTSAYVLVYVEAALAEQQRRPRDLGATLRAAEALVPAQLLHEIQWDNEALREEQVQRELRLAEQELRRHAEAVFQHYAGLIHHWEPLKRTADSSGNPHDPNARKFLHDAALLRFELFLYRLFGEQEVWTAYLMQSIDAQRKLRQWREEDEGSVLHFLAQTLRSHKCFASMLREKALSEGTKQVPQCELLPLDMAKLTAQYNVVLLQAHIIDEALHALKENRAELVKTIGMLAFIWARWNLEAEDKFRQNEVLLIMSALIYNTVNVLEKMRPSLSAEQLQAFQPPCEYFLLLLHAVEWPKGWKQPVIARLQAMFPQAAAALPGKQAGGGGARSVGDAEGSPMAAHLSDLKEAVLKHPLTQAQARGDAFELRRPEPGQEFFERHRALYAWVMQNDEAVANDFVLSQVGTSGEDGALKSTLP